MLYNGEGRLTLLIAITVMYNGVARTLGKLHTSKGDYCIKQWFSTFTSLFKMGTSLKGKNFRGQKFHSSARNYEWNLERTSNSSQSTRPVGKVYRTSALGRITWGSRITYFSLMFFIACAFKGHVHAFAGRVKVVSHSSCRASAIFKYFCPLNLLHTREQILTFKSSSLRYGESLLPHQVSSLECYYFY